MFQKKMNEQTCQVNWLSGLRKQIITYLDNILTGKNSDMFAVDWMECQIDYLITNMFEQKMDVLTCKVEWWAWFI